MLSVQDDYLGGAINMTIPEVKAKICQHAAENLYFFDQAKCENEFAKHSHIMDAVVSWKFGAYSGISITPTVRLNGIEVTVPENVDQWNKLIDDFLPNKDSFVRDSLKMA